jgi:hypothetical protein
VPSWVWLWWLVAVCVDAAMEKEEVVEVVEAVEVVLEERVERRLRDRLGDGRRACTGRRGLVVAAVVVAVSGRVEGGSGSVEGGSMGESRPGVANW